MTSDLVLEDLDRGVLTLTLNRPESMNAWIPPMESALFGRMDDAAADDDVRAIVVTGAGRGFCPGADMNYLSRLSQGSASLGGDEPATDTPRRTDRRHWPIIHAMSVSKPVIGAINGAVAGMGLALAMSFDIRFTVAKAKYTTVFARRGLIAEHGLSWTLPNIVGVARANDLLLSGRVFTGDEAVELGIANRLCEPDDLLAETQAYARDLAVNCSPASMAAMKRQVLEATMLAPHPALDIANDLMGQTIKGPDFVEGVASYTEKREPDFPPLGSGTDLDWPTVR